MSSDLSAVHVMDWASETGSRERGYCHNPGGKCWQPKLRQFWFYQVHGPNRTSGDCSEYSEA